MIRFLLVFSMLSFLGAGLSFAQYAEPQARGVLTAKRPYKGYLKRKRIQPGEFSNYYSPSQLHEVYGVEAGAAAEFNSVEIAKPDFEYQIKSPGARLSAIYGGDILVLGLDASYTNVNVDPNEPTMNEYFFNIYQVQPALAVSFTDNVTLGLTSAFVKSDKTLRVPGPFEDTDATLTNNYSVNTVGVSYHTSKMEAGVSYSSAAKDSESYKGFDGNNLVYIPANTTTFVRGNITDAISLMGALSYVEYERKAAASVGAFSKYRLEDRLASRLSLVYWTASRSSFMVTAKFTPATYSGPFNGGLNLGLVERNANLYGGMIDYKYAYNDKMSFLGLSAGLERGERDQIVNDVRYASSESMLKVAGSLNFKF